MSTLEVRIYPDPVLKQKAASITSLDDRIKGLLEDMPRVMHGAGGVGLAAPQVGESVSMVVADIGEGLVRLINPRIFWRSKEKETMEEGCLSLPDICVSVKRNRAVKVKAKNEKFEDIVLNVEDLMARVLQHEIDHLHGITIVDKLNPIARFFVKRKLARAKRRFSCAPTTKKL